MGILSGNSKDEPLHYGEIFDLWQSSMAAKGFISGYRALQFHAGDKELKKILGELIDQAELEASECDTILTHNGIATSPVMPTRPEVKFEDIPVGARFSDPEIAAMIGADTAVGLVACSQVMGKSIREDIGALFGKYHLTKAAIGLKILKMSKEKGWLIPPPLQVKRPDLVEA
ncbi:MAG: rane protein [Paenibacillus sp.]|nr:rane protein [Paenibacillus sp.]